MGKNEYYLKQIGARIMECRKEKGYQNREEFAKLLGISSNTLRNYENGVREIGTELLLRISMLLGVSTDRLLCKDEKSASTEAEARIEDLINSQRGQALLSKYSVLTEPAQGRVDATVNDIWSNPVNRIDQQPQEPSSNRWDYLILCPRAVSPIGITSNNMGQYMWLMICKRTI